MTVEMDRRDRGWPGSTALVIAVLLSACALTGQSVTRVYVQPFGSSSGDGVREETIKLLKGQKAIRVAASEAGADRVLTGSDRTYVKGYLSRNPRVRYRNGDSRPVYGGYLSVELKDPHDETVWSYLFTPTRHGPEDINKNLASQIVNNLLQFLASPSNTP